MTFAITIGSYRMPQFVELCVKRCRRLFGHDTPILISDDISDKSQQIKALADSLDCAYVVGEGQRGHFGGDMQAVLNSIVFGSQSDVSLKISQRFIPVLPEFVDALERAFNNPRNKVALPGQMEARQIARPQAAFYGRFGILTDAIGIRTGAISEQELLDAYINRVRNPKARSDCFVETTFGWLLATKFKDAHVILPEWTNHKPFTAKVYLRKSQSNNNEYAKVAEMEDVKGDWDLREWGIIEKGFYMPKPV